MIKRVFSQISAFLINFLSYSPFPLLYLISDTLAFILFGLFGYRKTIITNNLKNSFPDKSTEEIHAIRKKFYRNFTDVLVESIKCFTISGKELSRRVRFTNPEVFKKYHDQGKSIIAVLPHYANWEWMGISSGMLEFKQMHALYKPLKDPVMNQRVKTSRERFGLNLIDAKASRDIIPLEMEERPWNCFGFIADQTPRPQSAVWIDFLNQKTPFFKGTAMFARRLDLAIVFAKMRRIKRGFYEVDLVDLCSNSQEHSVEALTTLHARALEEMLLEQPENWLWSHKRWKHSYEEYLKQKSEQ